MKQLPTYSDPFTKFPGTRYMGSKNKLIGDIWNVIKDIEFNSVLDAFAGSGVVSYYLKSKGKKVYSNDFLAFSYHFSKSIIENSKVTVSDEDVDFLINNKTKNNKFIQKTFRGLYFSDSGNKFLDNVRSNINLLDNEYKQSLALSALVRACIKRRPRGIFTYTGERYNDNRLDLRKSLKKHFIENIDIFNKAVFRNKYSHKAFNKDIFKLKVNADLVYFDPPYFTPNSDNDFTRRYHFVEGLVKYWDGLEIQKNTQTKKFKNYKTPFSVKRDTYKAFEGLFHKFRNSKILVSYSSNSLPDKKELLTTLKKTKKRVEIFEINHTYSFGNQNHKIGNKANRVQEYLFLGY